MDRKRNTKARGRKTLRQNSYTKIKGDNTSAIVNISRWRIAPPRMLVKLGFQEERTLANAASTNTSFRFTANGAYDLDPSVGNLTMNGFNQWMSIYGSYRVIHFKATLTFNNLSSFPIRIATGFFPQTHFPFLNTEFNSNQWCREEKTLGPLTGMGQLKVVRQVELAKLVGTAAYEGDLTQYYGTAGSNPTSLASFNVAAYSTGGAVMPLGVCIVTDIEMIVELSLPTPLLQV